MKVITSFLILFSFFVQAENCPEAIPGKPENEIPVENRKLIKHFSKCSPTDKENLILKKSRALNLFTYLEALIGEMGRPPSFYQSFMDSSFNNKESEQALKDFLFFHQDLREKAPPSSEQGGLDLTQRITKEATLSKDLDDFYKRVSPLMSKDDFENLKGFMEYIGPAYDELVGKKLGPEVEKYEKKISQVGCKWKMKEKGRCVAKFLRAPAEAAADSPIGIYPNLQLGAVDGQSFVGVELMGVHPHSHDIHGDLGVVFHEKFHTLFHAQPPHKFKEMKSWFGKDGKDAFENFEEALATLVGNVWAYESVTGKRPQGKWYDEPHIENQARSLEPLLRRYLEDCRPMDRAFVEQVKLKFKEQQK